MIRYFTYRLAVGLVCLVLASCATLKEQVVDDRAEQPPATWQADKQQRQQIQVWEIRGRLGVQTQYNGGGMDIIWKQSEQEYSIRLIAPLGAGNYLIQGNDEYAEIRYPDGVKVLVDNVDDVFASALEVDLPATAVKDWIRGLPATALSTESMRWDEQGHLNWLEQSGWNVEMTKYNGSNILLPHAIYVTRDDDPDLDIRLVLRQWLVDN